MSTRHSNWILTLLPWLLLACALAVAILLFIPPRVNNPAREDTFDVDRALALIKEIAVEPRPMGSVGNQRGREKIIAHLRSIGIEPELQSFTVPNYYSHAREPVELSNILARIPGTDSRRTVAVMGHLDTVPTTRGANDDASALAIMLETARAILAGPPLRNDVVLIFTDGEEPPYRYGVSAFADSHPWFEDIRFVINLEAIGSGGPSLVVGKSGPGGWLIDAYGHAVAHPEAFSFITEISDLIGGSNTDFSTFKDARVPGFDVAYMTGSPIYHTMADDVESVNIRSLQQQGENTLALARYVANLDTDPPADGGEAVFFSLGHLGVVRYPEAWSLPLALAAGLVLFVAAWRQKGWMRILRSSLATLGGTLVSMAAGAGIWMLLGKWRSTMGVPESYAYLAGFTALASVIGWTDAKLTRRRLGTGPDAVGACVLWWALALVLVIAAPGISYLFTWPVLVAAIGLLWRTAQEGWRLWSYLRWAAVSLVTLVLVVPAVDFFYQFAQPRPGNLDSQVLATIIIPILLLSMTIELLRVFYPRRVA